MHRRYISDECYAVIIIGIGVGIIVAVLVFGVNDELGLITNAGFFCISVGGWLMSIVNDRRRLGLDVEKKF